VIYLNNNRGIIMKKKRDHRTKMGNTNAFQKKRKGGRVRQKTQILRNFCSKKGHLRSIDLPEKGEKEKTIRRRITKNVRRTNARLTIPKGAKSHNRFREGEKAQEQPLGDKNRGKGIPDPEHITADQST